DYRLTPFAVGLFDGVLDCRDGLTAREDAAQGEEAGLHDGVHPVTHADLLSDGVAVNHMEAQLPLRDRALDLPWDPVPHFLGSKGAVQQERSSGASGIQDRKPLEEAELMAGDEIRLADQIWSVN